MKRRSTVLRKAKSVPFKTITDAQRYDIIRKYRLGTTVTSIAEEYKLEEQDVKIFVNDEINALNTIKETNSLINSAQGLVLTSINPTKMLNKSFLSNVDDKKEAYAYYFAMTGSNEEALKQSGLDKWIPLKTLEVSKRYIFTVRGKYLRDIPEVKKYIDAVREERLKELKVDKKTIQSDLIEQIEQMKELAGDDNRMRNPLLKAIELLGKTIGSFQENIRVEEVSAKSGLEILMSRVKGEIEEGVSSDSEVYEIDDTNTVGE